jgi:hypothetical protein
MTATAQRRAGAAMKLPVQGWLRAATRTLAAVTLLTTAQALAQTGAKFMHLTADQAQTLLALAHDYHPRGGVPESHYTGCLAPYDAQAGNAQDRQRLDDALNLVEGAVRRMGYTSYAAITDEYERMRLAKTPAERQWMKQFRADVGQCLDRAAQPR